MQDYEQGAYGALLFLVEGHAFFAPQGDDIVCSAFSALLYNFLNSAALLSGSQLKVVDGKKFKVYAETIDNIDYFKLLIRSFIIGVTSLSEKYPEYVKLRIMER
jgi:uncharacterized protein YsxB (DUF464 family)